MRPAGLLRLVLVLAEVARGVKELLGDDGSSQLDVGEGNLGSRRLASLGHAGVAEFEERSHVGSVERDHGFTTQHSG